MSFVKSPTDSRKSPTLAPTWKPLSKMTVDDLRTELQDLGEATSGSKAVLTERLRKIRDTDNPSHNKEPESSTVKTTESAASELTMLFKMMKHQQELDRQQQQLDREAADRKFQLQLEESERRFQLQLEQIRQTSLEDRYKLSEFLKDAVNSEKQSSASSGDSCGPGVIIRKFRRMNAELIESLQDLEIKYVNSTSVEEINVFIRSVEIAMTDLKAFVDAKIDQIDDGDLKTEIIDGTRKSKHIYMVHIPLAKSRSSTLKAAEEADKAAGSLPSGVVPPTFNGDILTFPTFWESFEPLVHKNPKVSRFYKISYLKAALKGSSSGLLNGFPSVADSYEPAIDAVLKRYGRKQAIVRNHVKDLLQGEKVEFKIDKVRRLLDASTAKRAILSQHNVSWDQLFTQVLESQLPGTLYERWIRKISPLIDADTVPDSDLLFEFLTTELATMEALHKSQNGRRPVDTREKNKDKLASVSAGEAENSFSAQSLVVQSVVPSCTYCSKPHLLKECYKFLKLTPPQRIAGLVMNPGKVCFRCLSPKEHKGHPKNFYQCKERCSISGCGKSHHELLHVSSEPLKDTKSMVSTIKRPISTLALRDSDVDTLLPTALGRIHHNGEIKQVRIAFDSFSQTSFVTRSLADSLKLSPIKSDCLDISGFGGNSASRLTDVVKFTLESTDGLESVNIEAYVQEGVICAPLKNIDLRSHQMSHLKGLNLADPLPRRNGAIDILLGGQYYFSLMQGEMMSPVVPEIGPYAIHTIFGWVLAGPCCKLGKDGNNSSSCLLLTTTQKDASLKPDPWLSLNHRLEGFGYQDSIGIGDKKVIPTAEEGHAVKQFERSVQFDSSKYIVSFPFRRSVPDLKSNYHEANSGLLSAEKMLHGKPQNLRNYDVAIMDYEKNGFEEFRKPPHYFVPHHPVFKESSVRCAARTDVCTLSR